MLLSAVIVLFLSRDPMAWFSEGHAVTALPRGTAPNKINSCTTSLDSTSGRGEVSAKRASISPVGITRGASLRPGCGDTPRLGPGRPSAPSRAAGAGSSQCGRRRGVRPHSWLRTARCHGLWPLCWMPGCWTTGVGRPRIGLPRPPPSRCGCCRRFGRGRGRSPGVRYGDRRAGA
jgi:hypothetical protein